MPTSCAVVPGSEERTPARSRRRFPRRVSEMRAGILVLLAAALAAGCATAGSHPRPAVPPTAQPAAGGELRAGDADLTSYILRVRELSRHMRPGGVTGGDLAERWSQDLADAISRFDSEPTVATEIGLAQAYVRAGILDHAYEHFASASRVEPREGAAWDGLARVWRDWGLPHLGLGDAYRAVSAAPRSAMRTQHAWDDSAVPRRRPGRARSVRDGTQARSGSGVRAEQHLLLVADGGQHRGCRRPRAAERSHWSRGWCRLATTWRWRGPSMGISRAPRRSSERLEARPRRSTTSESSTFPSAATRLPRRHSIAQPCCSPRWQRQAPAHARRVSTP